LFLVSLHFPWLLLLTPTTNKTNNRC
jgi:hypothetical protein